MIVKYAVITKMVAYWFAANNFNNRKAVSQYLDYISTIGINDK